MDPSDAIQLLIMILLICCSAFFSSAETALTTANKIRMKSLADEGEPNALIFLEVTENPAKMLTAILIGNNIANLFASSLATTLAIRLLGSTFIGVATGLLTLIILVFGEITPKSSATLNAEKLALRYVKYINMLMIGLTPIIYVVNKLAYFVMKLLGIDPNAESERMTENELRTILKVSNDHGVIETDERKMINNVVDFGDSCAKDVMVPRVDVTFADVELTYDELIELFRQEHYTRMPVYEGSKDNVIGIINMKDLLLYDHQEEFSIRNYLRKPFYTYEYQKTSELMYLAQKSKFNCIIVLDEYGITVGLVTLEDLLEEIVGDIRDEYDEDEEKNIQKITKTEYVIDASMKLDDINDKLQLNLEAKNYDSLGGLVIERLNHAHPPEAGEKVTDNGITFIVDTTDNIKIETVRILLPEPIPEAEVPEAEDDEW